MRVYSIEAILFYNGREDQHHHLSDVKLLLDTCIKKLTLMLVAYKLK